MKKFFAFLYALLIIVTPLAAIQQATAIGPNLISNPSAETQNATNANLPQDWKKDQWGTSTRTLTYDKTAANANDGTKSLYAQLTARTSGDIKWSHKEVAVTPSTSYTFTDYYKSNITSEVVVQTKGTNGAYTYQSLKTLAASAVWTNNTIIFTTTATAKGITVFHLINKVGWIYTDNYFLGLTNGAVTAPTVNITAPTSLATVQGTTTITANASDAGTVAGVQFKVNNINVGSEDTVAPYSAMWDTKTLANGAHSITATARNSSGLTATSSAVTVTVANQLPAATINVTSPANNAAISGVISLDTTTTNASSVQFYVDGVVFGTEDTQQPFSASLDSTILTNGAHTIHAVAKNSEGLATVSATINFNVTNIVAPPVSGNNLITNPSTESADSATKPAAWSTGKWGTNTATFTYEQSGQSGEHSVLTQITSYTSGDAKWYFDPVTVNGSTKYDYSHYYKSSATTDVVAQYTDANGVDTYAWLTTLPASATWQKYSTQITTPANAKKVTILHVLYSVGTLQLDDTYLGESAPVIPDTAVIKNGSFETASATNTALPQNWNTGSWGTNNAFFEYLSSESYSGAKSVKLTISSYTDGDAKWFFDPITTLTSGNMYRFSTRYKTNTFPKAVAQFNRTDGTTLYFGMPNPQPNGTTDWQYYTDTFTVPNNVKDVTIFFFLNSVGWVQLDDQTIGNYQPAGFNRPLLSLTFDDGFEDNNTTVLPMTDAYGFKTTQCYATQFVAEDVNNPNLVLQFKNAGHEICSHTVSHPFLTSLTTAQQNAELSNSQTYLQNIIGGPVPNFASPYGDYNQATNNEIKKYYRSHRTVDEGFNSRDNFDIYRVRVQNILSTTTAAQVQSWVQQAQATNTWLVLVYHKVSSTGVGPFDSYTTDFAAQLQAIAASGITVKTYGAALDEIAAQL